MTSIVITGHGNFATGLASMLELVLGECEQVYFVDFTKDLSSDDLKNKFQEIYSKTKGDLIFLCDIAGGTPFNQASMLLYENGKQYGVLGGVSIPVILDAIDQRDTITDTFLLLKTARTTGCENIKLFGEQEESTQIQDEDGI